MTIWRDKLNGDPLPWLLEDDALFFRLEGQETLRRARCSAPHIMRYCPVNEKLANVTVEGLLLMASANRLI
jgi:hypothetical protein